MMDIELKILKGETGIRGIPGEQGDRVSYKRV